MHTAWIAVLDLGRQGFSVNLTDTQRVWRRRRYRSATRALIDVAGLMKQGHTPASPRAVAALQREAQRELMAAPAATAPAMAAD